MAVSSSRARSLFHGNRLGLLLSQSSLWLWTERGTAERSLSGSSVALDMGKGSNAVDTSSAGSEDGGHLLEGIHTATSGASNQYKAAVVGAGPGGLAVVATLLDNGQNPILWIDPHFNAGRLSTYTEVPSNTKVKLFKQYVTSSPSLKRFAQQALEPFEGQDPDSGCPLDLAVRMVKVLTNCIRAGGGNQVHCVENTIKELNYVDSKWHLDTGEKADMVYLATGSHPRSLPLDSGVPDIDLDVALTPSKLTTLVSESDTVGVVGSSHSAILALRNLVQCKSPPQKIINFYRSPLLYAQYMDNWILYDNTGLKGEAAEWAKVEIDTGKLEGEGALTRTCVKSCTPNEQLDLWQQCTKIVQAVGYDRNELPKIVVNGRELKDVEYDPHTGRIADGLFGYGIAFPEQTTDPYGNEEFAVGFWKFMRYSKATIPNHTVQNV